MFSEYYRIDYKKIIETVYKLITELEIKQLPVSVDYIANELWIKQIRNCDLQKSLLSPNQNGLAVLSKGKFYIIYNEKDNLQERRFTVAHEIGHILLEHLFSSPASQQEKEIREQEADIFATLLLAPICVIRALKLQTPEEIQSVCNIPYQYIQWYLEFIKSNLGKFSVQNINDLENKTYKQFQLYINNFNINKRQCYYKHK